MHQDISLDKVAKTLEESIQHSSVIACYLYGSFARGEATSLSDLDIAILWAEKASARVRKRELLRLSQELSEKLGYEVDVRSLNEASLELQFRVVTEGKVIFCENKSRRLEFEDRTVMHFLDFKPMIAMYNQYMHHRIKETGRL